ncbi:MAG: hypothetical protein HQ495_11775 [Alphaproteobacteria bacterium]|nr:hypothetical protein [Alphaproteobacteria bacterium]
MTVADSTLEDRIARLERSRSMLSIVAAAAVLAAAIAMVLPFLPLGGPTEIVLRNAAGAPTVRLSAETGMAELHGLRILNDQDKVRGEFVPTKLGAEITLLNSNDQPVVILNNSSPSQGGRLSLFGIGDRAAFFGGTVSGDDFGMEIRMRAGHTAVLKTGADVPFFSLSDRNGEALIQVADGVAEFFTNRISILGPGSLPRMEISASETGATLSLRDADDQVRASLAHDDQDGTRISIQGSDGAAAWQAP